MVRSRGSIFFEVNKYFIKFVRWCAVKQHGLSLEHNRPAKQLSQKLGRTAFYCTNRECHASLKAHFKQLQFPHQLPNISLKKYKSQYYLSYKACRGEDYLIDIHIFSDFYQL